MNKEEAIKYLQQLYPNGGHCWLDEQRIEAISMAINALQEEPVSEKKCMFTNDNYTDEDRMVLCEDCKEKCEYNKKEEPASSIWHDASEEPNGDNSIVIAYDNGCTVEPSFKDFKSYSEWGTIKKSYRVKQWAYVNDVLNLTNKEELVSEDFEKVLEDKIRDAQCWTYIEEEGCECPIFQEFGADYLEKFARWGAKWQKEKEYTCYEEAFEDGAKWKVENLWKPADGDDLPIIDREVIALLNNGKVVFAHRPPEYWDGKDIITGKVTRNYPKTYDKGGWNIPDVKWWLDVELPKEREL